MSSVRRHCAVEHPSPKCVLLFRWHDLGDVLSLTGAATTAALRLGTPIAEVPAAVSMWHDLADVLSLTGAATTAALTAVEQHRLSFWDALIWATARDADVRVILSEDFQDGREIEGVRFVNPFKHS